VVQPGGASTPLVGGPGEPLSRTYSGFFSRVDYRQRLELNARDSNEDVLFQQEMWDPERGVGGVSGIRRAFAGESRNSPPVQLLEELEYQKASKSASERGRRQHREYEEDRSSAGREEVGEGTDHEEPEPAGRDPGRVQQRPTNSPCLRGTVPVQHCIQPSASQASREHAAAETGSVRLTSQRLQRCRTEATTSSSERLGGT